ncbi:MAG: hypothetical protein ABIP75_00545 [Pyrinomonadaceae bacterium]
MVIVRSIQFLFLALLIGVFTVPVLANYSVPVSEGSIALDRHLGSGMGGEVNLLVDNIQIGGTIYNFGVTPDCNHFGDVCLRGSSVRLPSTHITEDGFSVGTVVINGQTISQVYYLGGFHFDSPSIVIPRMSAISGVITVTAPFNLSGDLLGCTEPMPSSFCSPVHTVFSKSFVGSGVVTYRLRAVKGLDFANLFSRYSYDLVSVSLQFTNQTAAE